MSHVCDDCQKAADKVNACFTTAEKIALITGTAALSKSIEGSTQNPHDRMVASSIMAKLFLSFPLQPRQSLLNALKLSTRMDYKIDDCSHAPRITT